MAAVTRVMRTRHGDAAAAANAPVPAGAPGEATYATVIDLLWDALAPTGVSWVGVYFKTAGADEMLLGPRRDKPACSPIGLQGVCGRGWRERRPIVVRDVGVLGAGYIACDPRDRSEVVVPIFAADGSCRGVLDADSYDVGSFSAADADGLAAVLKAAGLTAADQAGGPLLEI